MNRFELVLPLLLPLFLPIAATGQNRESAAVIGAICSDRHVPDSAHYIHRLAASMSAEARYEFLCEWVLPSTSHTTFRLQLDFTTTHPAGVGSLFRASDSPTESDFSEQDSRPLSVRVQTGGTLVSPALDLVETTASLKRLGELRSRIERVEQHDELQQRCRLTMLGLVELAAGEHDKAVAWFEKLYSRVAARTHDEFEGRWPETLAVHASMSHPRTREAAADILYTMLQSQVRSGVARGPDAWDRWVTATAGSLAGRRSLKDVKETATHASAPDSELNSNWLPFSKTTAWSRGRGLPGAAWRRSPGMVENVASHDEDYLVYRIPLRGNFEVECDVMSFNWRDSHLMFAGTYVAPVYDRSTYGVGSFRSARPAGTIEPRLSDCDDWIRYRAIVRDGTCSTYFNGRLIHTESLTAEHDPWLAIRSAWFADGAARNVRITGQPVIPEQIRLSISSDLSGWSAYFDEPVGELDHWRQGGDFASGGGIIGRHEAWSSGLAYERLLQYYRPMLEDGTIEYEFYYREGESHVHPALDRRALILDPHGIQIHWITDGVFERSALSPDNLSVELPHRRGPRQLPLRDKSWNRMRIALAGNTLSLTLNDHLVYQFDLEPTNQRTFGLFYWSDRTEARVRNVVWTGNWPKVLPPVEEQELAGEGTRVLDKRIPQLTAHFQHDFARDGLPLDRFVTEKMTQQSAEPSENGVRVVIRAAKGYTPWWIGPHLRVEGDFDIRAKFEALELSGTVDSSTGLFLQIVMEDPETTHASIYRGCLRKPNSQDRLVVQSEFNRRKPSGIAMTWPGSTAEESTSGTLRVARRGDTIYCLFAEADSPNFRLIHTEVVPRDAVRFDGVRLMGSIFSVVDGPCEVAVTWKSLSIWGEKITEFPKESGAVAPKTSQ